MEMLNLRFMVLAIFAFIGVLISGEINVVVGQCEGDIMGLVAQCAAYVQKGSSMTEPSQGCCSVIKRVDIPCACQHVTKQVEQFVDMDKVIHVIARCGRPLPQGMKCGSYTVPGGGGR